MIDQNDFEWENPKKRNYGKRSLCAAALSGLLFVFCGVAIEGPPAAGQAPDDSKTNQKDRGSATADNQSESAGDRELSRKIRRAVTSDKSLSTYAHNVKIITIDGRVTLKGPVRSEEEKASIFAKAAEIAGKANITDEITVQPKQQ